MSSPAKISKRVERELQQSKVVVRRLPPDFTEEQFLEMFSPLPPNNYYYFTPGDPTLGPYGCARAYINFEDESLIIPFRDQFDGFILTTDKGHKYQAIVEFAPFQGIPKKMRRKQDARAGMIDQDADYQAFLKEYESKPEPLPSVELSTYVEEIKATKSPEVQITPLIQSLLERKAAKSARAAARKNKVYTVESKKQKGGGEGATPNKPRSSKDRKSSADWEAKGTKQDRSTDHYQRKSKRNLEDAKQTSKSSSHEDWDGTGNHLGDGYGPTRDEHRGGKSKQDSTWRKEEERVKDERRSTGSAKRESTRPEDGDREDGERMGRGRNKGRPDRPLYTPGRGRGRGRGGERGDASGKPRDGNRRDYSRSKQEYTSSKYDDYGSKRREREEMKDDTGSKECEEYGGKRRDWSRKSRGGGKGSGFGSYDRPKSSQCDN